MDFLWVVVAYLIGSLSFGRIAGAIRGVNLAERDTPGASGAWRQLGPVVGVLVALADIAKGSLVAYLCAFTQSDWAMALMGVAVVAGHNWPIFFGFRGGGGIAPTLGFFGFLYPTITFIAVAIGLGVAGLYWQLYWKRHRQSWYPFPVGALVGYVYALIAFWPTGIGFWAFLLVSLTVALRGLRMIRPG